MHVPVDHPLSAEREGDPAGGLWTPEIASDSRATYSHQPLCMAILLESLDHLARRMPRRQQLVGEVTNHSRGATRPHVLHSTKSSVGLMTAPRLCGEPDGEESPGALLKGRIFFGFA